MEPRHYITFGIALLILQLLIFSFSRTLTWLFRLKRATSNILTVALYLSANSLIILHLLKIYPIFRPMALILTLLLFAFFIRFLTACLRLIFKSFLPQEKLNNALRLFYPVAFFSLIGFGVYNAYTPKVEYFSVKINKPLSQPIRIGLASDFHLGKYFGGKQLDQLAEIMQQNKVDLILLPGDIMDDNITAYVAENMQPHLAKLRAPLGVYATLGNHDYFEDRQNITREIIKAGIHVLSDEAITINNQFILVGRNDNLEKNRPTAEQILKNQNTHLPVFLMDHRPTDILIHSKLPIDIQVSGHTHKGQIFPANLITKWMYELDYGYKQIENGHFFVTSGYGFWGVPMRLGSQSEIMIIDVQGTP